jgi:hypothetical protein
MDNKTDALGVAPTDVEADVVPEQVPVGSLDCVTVVVGDMEGVALTDDVLVRVADVQSTVPSAEGERLDVLIAECVCERVIDADFVAVEECEDVTDGLVLGNAEHGAPAPVDQ